MNCPNCGSNDVRRSHRVGFAGLIGKLSFSYPYHCRECGNRFRSIKLLPSRWTTRIFVGLFILFIFLFIFIPQLYKESPIGGGEVIRNSIHSEKPSIDIRESTVGAENDSSESLQKPNGSEGEEESVSYLKKAVEDDTQTVKPEKNGPKEKSQSTASIGVINEERATTDENEIKKSDLFFYSLHIGSFREFNNAKAEVEILTEKGFEAWWEKVEIPRKGEWFRVFVGRKDTESEAEKFGNELRNRGVINSFLISRKSQ